MQCTYIICKYALSVHLILCNKWLIHLTVSNFSLANLDICLSVLFIYYLLNIFKLGRPITIKHVFYLGAQ